jgi:ClpP class serine protease
MKYSRLATRVYNTPLLIEPHKAEVIEAVFRAHVASAADHEAEAEARAEREAREAEHAAAYAATGVSFQVQPGGYLLGDNGVAIVQVFGTLVQRADAFDAASGFLGYNRIGARLAAAMEDEETRAILLEIDSPGGEANGLFELATRIRAMSKTKPIWAHANEEAYSAAYAIGSAAQKLFTPETGAVGSVGVIAMHVDQSKRDASQGYKYTPIYAGEKKNDFSSHFPLSERALADAQASVDRIYDIFVAAVAEGRGIAAKAVRGTEAGVLNPDQAKAVGFIDGIASFSDTLAMLGKRVALKPASVLGQYGTAAAASQSTQGVRSMSVENTTPPAAAEQPSAPSADALKTARDEGFAAGERAGAARAAQDERARVATIVQSEHAIGRFGLASHLAFETDMSAEAAVRAMSAAPKEANASQSPNLFAAHMARIGNPNIAPDETAAGASASGSGADEDEAAYAARLAAQHNAARGVSKPAK